MISFYTLFTIFFFHWLFDFVLQTDRMAKGKSSCNFTLLEHVGTYTFGLLIIGMFNCMSFRDFYIGLAWALFNGVAHFITDWLTSRCSSALWKDEKVHDFFVTIGLDQKIHYLTLTGTFIYATSL